MEIFIEKGKKNIKREFMGNVGSLLKKIKINPETVLVTRDNELLTSHDKLENTDKIKIISVVSGG